MTVLDKLLYTIKTGWIVTSVDVGNNWVLAQVQDEAGQLRAGVAAAPRTFPDVPAFPVGSHSPNVSAHKLTEGLRSSDPSASAVGLATLNAVNAPDEHQITTEDAADWLSEQTHNKAIAIFGRFPFIQDEIKPFASDVFVFEQTPNDGEYSAEDMPTVLPKADLIAITGTTIINHTIDDILQHTIDQQTVVVLGPSTPLTTLLFDFGIDVMFGVRVVDVDAVRESVQSHLGFQKVQGLQRVSLFRDVHYRGAEDTEKG